MLRRCDGTFFFSERRREEVGYEDDPVYNNTETTETELAAETSGETTVKIIIPTRYFPTLSVSHPSL